ncbi:MAG: hypothetical protein V1878_06110 [bacterium]
MKQIDNKWPAGRILHLGGGCRAINDHDPVVRFLPNTIEGIPWQIETSAYGAIYGILESLGFRIIGVDFYSHALEVEGTVPPNWRSYCRTRNTSWPTEETARKWRNIGNAGFKRKDGLLWDTASRIGHQLRVCDWRLREVSEAYTTQLLAKLKRNDFKIGTRFEDGFTRLTYLSLQSFLVDACILRDYLAEFAAEYIYKPMVSLGNLRITAMGALKKKVLNKILDPDDLTVELQVAASDNGWLTLLGNYRDLVVHSAPLALAKAELFSLCDQLSIAEGAHVPILRCPIPESPAKIRSARSTCDHFSDFENQFNSFVKAATGDISVVEGMDYATAVLGKLANLAGEIAARSPVAPEMMVFDSSNILGGIKVETNR